MDAITQKIESDEGLSVEDRLFSLRIIKGLPVETVAAKTGMTLEQVLDMEAEILRDLRSLPNVTHGHGGE